MGPCPIFAPERVARCTVVKLYLSRGQSVKASLLSYTCVMARMARNASSLLDEVNAAEAADQDALNASEILRLQKKVAAMEKERDEAKILAERRKTIITQKEADIDQLRGQLEWHEKLQAYNNKENYVSSREKNGETQQDNVQAAYAFSAADSRYKKKLCTSWIETGRCKYGQNCHFAHGSDDQTTRQNEENINTADYFALYVMNVPPDATKEQLEKCFSEYGPLHTDHKIHILKGDKPHKSVACFVNYCTFEVAERVLWASQNQQLFVNHACLHVKPARNTKFVLVRENRTHLYTHVVSVCVLRKQDTFAPPCC